MPSFDLILCDGTAVTIVDADGYTPEGAMTTFFRSDGGRQRFDCWSVRVASYRTEQIFSIRRCEHAETRQLQSA